MKIKIITMLRAFQILLCKCIMLAVRTCRRMITTSGSVPFPASPPSSIAFCTDTERDVGAVIEGHIVGDAVKQGTF
jgi:hypothetical protein